MQDTEWKIAQRLYFSEENHQRSSRPAVRVALGGIIIGVLVMIVAISVVVGFKQEITQKVAGFGSHIQVVNFDNNSTYELQPIFVSDSLLQTIRSIQHVTHVSTFASKPGIIKTDSAFQGIVFKGTDYWAYFEQNIVEGALPSAPNEILLSTELAKRLQLQGMTVKTVDMVTADDLPACRLVILPPRVRCSDKIAALLKNSRAALYAIFRSSQGR